MKNIILIIGLSALLLSCTNEPEDQEFIDFKINIDSVFVADTLVNSDTLSIFFDGIVGYDGCSQFDHFEVKNRLNTLEITTWGKREKATICPTVVIQLDKKELKLYMPEKGTQTIMVNLTDSSAFLKRVYIK